MLGRRPPVHIIAEKLEQLETLDYRLRALRGRWLGMKYRCTHHPSYVGRVFVCERWESFENFVEDMWAGFQPGYHLDRKDNHGGYCKDNCWWLSPEQHAEKTRAEFLARQCVKGRRADEEKRIAKNKMVNRLFAEIESCV